MFEKYIMHEESSSPTKSFQKMFIFDSSLRYTAPGEGNGNPLQYSCLENSMDTGAWWAIVHGVANSRTRQSDSHTHQPLNDKYYTE